MEATVKKRPTPDFLNWLVPARSRIQDSLRRLHQISLYYDEHPEQSDSEQCAIYLLLLGAGFSLWRAVFQAHTDLSRGKNLEAAGEFLETLVHDNAVSYLTEKNSWSFGYYLNNAKFRLFDIHGRLTRPIDSQLETKLQAIGGDTPYRTTPIESQKTWDAIHEVFNQLVDDLRNQLGIRTE
jgi:hypothetical protein